MILIIHGEEGGGKKFGKEKGNRGEGCARSENGPLKNPGSVMMVCADSSDLSRGGGEAAAGRIRGRKSGKEQSLLNSFATQIPKEEKRKFEGRGKDGTSRLGGMLRNPRRRR